MFGKLMALGQLTQLKDRTLQSLTREELEGLARTFGISVPITEELRTAGLALLKGESLDTVSDMIQSPESIQLITNFLRGGLESVSEFSEAQQEVDSMSISFF